jgi:hypothetical protein
MGETHRKFDADFREGARLVRETGKPVVQMAPDREINEDTLRELGERGQARTGPG